MNYSFDISASIVLYKENLIELQNTVNCFLKIPLKKRLYLIDNNESGCFKDKFIHQDIVYIPNFKNIGFGRGHNLILQKIKNHSKHHLVLNPDITFNPITVVNLVQKLDRHQLASMIAPKVLYPDGRHQFSCRRFPKIPELLARRFIFLEIIFNKMIKKGKYKDKNLENSFFADYVTGCFQLFKTDDLVKLNGFDERYFLYMEDVDICKKIDKTGKKIIYFPKEQITHVLKQGSSKSLKLFLIHTSSAIKYFLKWGF